MFFIVFFSPAIYAMQAVTKVRHAPTTASWVLSKVFLRWQDVSVVREVSLLLVGVGTLTFAGEKILK